VCARASAHSRGATDEISLHETYGVVQPDTFLPLLREPVSAVSRLSVHAFHWAPGAFEGLVRALRTNEATLDVTLNNYHNYSSLPLVEELLTTYNCTLEEFELYPRGVNDNDDDGSQDRIDALLERNQRVRSLFKPDSDTPFERYHLERKSMWPFVLAEYGRFPTQLYRFVRHGNLEGLEDVAAAEAAEAAAAETTRPRGRKKRRRPRISKERCIS
jgi:hypothetical protein